MENETQKLAFGHTIKEFRLGKGLSLRKLATKADMSHSYLSQLELGKKSLPSPQILKNIAKALEIDYFILARLAGYLDFENETAADKAVRYEALINNSIDGCNIIQFKVPAVVEEIGNKGEKSLRFMSPEESKKNFLDLNYLLKSDENLYFKDKLLNRNERDKMAGFLTLLIDNPLYTK